MNILILQKKDFIGAKATHDPFCFINERMEESVMNRQFPDTDFWYSAGTDLPAVNPYKFTNPVKLAETIAGIGRKGQVFYKIRLKTDLEFSQSLEKVIDWYLQREMTPPSRKYKKANPKKRTGFSWEK